MKGFLTLVSYLRICGRNYAGVLSTPLFAPPLSHTLEGKAQLFGVVNRLSEVRKCDAFHPNRDAYEHSLSPEALLKLTLRKHFYSAGYSFC